jgi:hypothetical protein
MSEYDELPDVDNDLAWFGFGWRSFEDPFGYKPNLDQIRVAGFPNEQTKNWFYAGVRAAQRNPTPDNTEYIDIKAQSANVSH